MSAIVDAIICKPFGYVLRLIYQLVGSYGVAIILFTILTKIILLPFTMKSKRNLIKTQSLQPKIKEIEKKYAATNKQKYQEEVQKLYTENDANPMGGCLPLLITFPIMIGLYYVIQRPLSFIMGLSSAEIKTIAETLSIAIPENAKQFELMEIQIASQAFQNFDTLVPLVPKLLPIDFNFLGINLASVPTLRQINILYIIPILSGLTAALTNFVTTKMQAKMSGVESPAGQNATLTLLMPLMSVWFGFILPAGVGIYWIVSNLVMAVQEVFISKYLIKENAEKERIAELERAAREKARREIAEQNKLANQARQAEMNKKGNKKE